MPARRDEAYGRVGYFGQTRRYMGTLGTSLSNLDYYDVDVVTSARNEEGSLAELVERLSTVFRDLGKSWRLIVADNGSTDETWTIICRLSRENPNVTGIRMSRDFGFEGAIAAALSLSDADTVVIMASDLQDPPEYIATFMALREQGYDHVYQVVTDRPGVTLSRRLSSTSFYWLAEKMTRGSVKRDSSTFRLISGQMRTILNELPERNRFSRAMVNWIGFSSIGVALPRAPRTSGGSKAVSRHVFSYALKGIVANSLSLLNILGILGLVVSAVAVLSTAAFAVIWLTQGVPFAGFGMLIGAIFLGFGFVFLSFGVMAQYVALIFEEVRGRPNFVVAEVVGKSGPNSGTSTLEKSETCEHGS